MNRRFQPLPSDECGHFRGVLMAVAQDMHKRLPDTSERLAAIDHLVAAADLACEALAAG